MPNIGPFNAYYYPTYHGIIAISQSFPALVTTNEDHQYITGAIVRIVIPTPYTALGTYYNFGMNQINGIASTISVTGNDTFTLDAVDSTSFDPFSVPAGVGQTAQCIPIGEVNSILYGATKNVL